jgi:iron(III) transport system substrate-binding protein
MRGACARPLATLALVPLLAALAACGSPADSAESADEAEEVDASQLVVYSGRNEELVGDLLERFEQASGIPVSVRYGNTAQLAAQLLEEGDRTAADVFFSQDAGALGALAKADRLAALPQASLEKVDSGFQSDDGHWVGTSGRARVLVYDPDQVSEDQLPQTVEELTGPAWKGKVGIAPSNASFETFVTAMRVIDGEDAARTWLEGMVANDVQTFDNNVQILNAAEDGKIAVGLINHYYWYEQVAEEGLAAVPARLKFFDNGDVGGLVNVAGVGILAASDRPTEAQQLVDFLLSDEGQRYFADVTKEYPLITGVPTAPDLPPLASLVRPDVDLSDLDTLDQTLAMLEEAGLT